MKEYHLIFKTSLLASRRAKYITSNLNREFYQQPAMTVFEWETSWELWVLLAWVPISLVLHQRGPRRTSGPQVRGDYKLTDYEQLHGPLANDILG